MKAGDVIALSSNRLIMFTTLSKYSHVAIAANDKDVYEATLEGIRKVPLSTCVEKARNAWILTSPIELNDNEVSRLMDEFFKQRKSGANYSYLRGFYAGLEAIVNAWFYIFAFTIIAWSWLSDEVAYLPISLMLLAFYPIARKIKLFARSPIIKGSRFLPQILTQEIPNKFCSQLVVDLESKFNGLISKNILRPHESRPCDVVEACMAAGYKQSKI